MGPILAKPVDAVIGSFKHINLPYAGAAKNKSCVFFSLQRRKKSSKTSTNRTEKLSSTKKKPVNEARNKKVWYFLSHRVSA